MSYMGPALDVDPPMYLNPYGWSGVGFKSRGQTTTIPVSGSMALAGRCWYVPFYLTKPYDLQRFWWQNGATVGTDSLQAAIYSVDGSNVMDCIVSTPRTLSAGTANHLQYATCSVVAHGITSGADSTGGGTQATASVTLKSRPGVMYAIAIVNTHGTAAIDPTTVTTTGGAVSFTKRNSQNFNSTLSQVGVWTAVPSADVTATITITWTAHTTTGCAWSLVAFTNVDTTTNDGVVQTAKGSGSSTTPLATLAAFGSANNATFGAHGTAQTAAAPGAGFIEMHDVTYSTPTAGLETEFNSGNDTTVDATITSAAWGSVAAEIKSLGTTYDLAPGHYYSALTCTGTTATVFRVNSAPAVSHTGVYSQDLGTAPGMLPYTATPVSTNSTHLIYAGITSRATP